MTPAATFAAAIGVNPQQRAAYDLKARPYGKLLCVLEEAVVDGDLSCGLWEVRQMDTYAAVLAAATALGPRRPEFSPLWLAAIGLSRSVGTARLCPVASARIKALRPWALCQLLGRIAEEVPVLTTAAVDAWLRRHAEEL